MKEVSKEQFHASFENLNVSTGCPSSYKVWEVRLRANNKLIALAIEDSLMGKRNFTSRLFLFPDKFRRAWVTTIVPLF